MAENKESSDPIPDSEELEGKTNAELIEALRENTRELERLKRDSRAPMGLISGGPEYWKKVAEEVKAKRGGEVSTAQRAMALYYLSVAANDGEMINKSALGRLLCFFTGQTPSSVKDYAQKPIGKKDENKKWTPKSKADRAAVRTLLVDLGVTKAVELMDKDEK